MSFEDGSQKQLLNRYGGYGWDLVSAMILMQIDAEDEIAKPAFRYVFKRPVEYDHGLITIARREPAEVPV